MIRTYNGCKIASLTQDRHQSCNANRSALFIICLCLFVMLNALRSLSFVPDKGHPRKVNGRLKFFKRCSVPKRLAYVMIISRNFFLHGKFPEFRISWKRTCLISAESRQK